MSRTLKPVALRFPRLLHGAGLLTCLNCLLVMAAVAMLVHRHWPEPRVEAAGIELMVTREVPVAVPPATPAPAVEETMVAAVSAPVIEPPSPEPIQSEPQPGFNGRPLRPVRTITMLVTAYSPDERSCGKWADGRTASGYSVWTNGMKFVAADTDVLPFGTLVTVPGYHDSQPVPVLDRGGKIKGRRLDVLYPTHERALRWGAQRLEVTVWEYAD